MRSLSLQDEAKLALESDKLTVTFDVIIENFGDTPAHEVWFDGVLSFDKVALALLMDTLDEPEPTSAHARTTLFPRTPEGTQIELEYDSENTIVGAVYVLAYCRYRAPGDGKWRHSADICEVIPGDAPTRFYGMDGDQMKFGAPPNTVDIRKVRLRRAPGMLPTMT